MTTEPTLGWAALSRSALNRAENELEENSEGMRDEVGVLALHTGYANRFFPGTSVQQTRLRYALFVPWQINELLKASPRSRAPDKDLRKSEIQLALRLPDERGAGNIGRTRARQGRAVSIPPSESYWVALTSWGVLHQAPPIVPAPARAEVFAHWLHWPDPSRRQAGGEDDDRRPIEQQIRLFHPELPAPPSEFVNGGKLTFALLSRERTFLRARLMETRRDDTKQPSLLARLVASAVRPGEKDQPWSKAILEHAHEEDKSALRRARDAASLSAIARAAYYAALEGMQEERDGRTPGTKHRDHLVDTLTEHGKRAVALRLEEVEEDGVYLGGLLEVLRVIQHWAAEGRQAPSPRLVEVLGDWEQERKGSRARLPKTGTAKDARFSWVASKAGLAEPIRYRWGLVSRFLHDLAG
jgi:hypothetical protein